MSGAWVAGTKLPSRRKLAADYNVALATVERACSKLLADGLLVADGRGTLVSDRTATPLSVSATGPSEEKVLNGAIVGLVDCMQQEFVSPPVDSNDWSSAVMSAFEGAISRTGGRLRLCNRVALGHTEFTLANAVDWLARHGASAICLVGLHSLDDPLNECLSKVHVPATPVVTVTAFDMHLPASGVYYDNWMAGYQAAEHLLTAGYERLWFLGPSSQPWAAGRLDGARSAAAYAGRTAGGNVEALLGVQSFGISPVDHGSLMATVSLLLSGISDDLRSFGVIASNDVVAAAVKATLADRGLNVGPDYGLVGFDNSPYARDEDITTFRPPLEEIGYEAANIVVAALAGNTNRTQICLRCQIIPRGSTVRKAK